MQAGRHGGLVGYSFITQREWGLEKTASSSFFEQ